MFPIKRMEHQNSITDGKNYILLDRCWACGIPTFSSSSWPLSRPCDKDLPFPWLHPESTCFACLRNLSHLSLMLCYSLPSGSCSNVLRSACLLRRFIMTAPFISTTLPGEKEWNSTSSLRYVKHISRSRRYITSETLFP